MEEENVQIDVKSIIMEGYTSYNLKEINDVALLKSLLNTLAYNHSRSIELHKFKTVNIKNCRSLVKDDFKKTLCILYEIIEKKNSDEVSSIAFRKGIEKQYYSIGNVLKSENGNIYVNSHVLQGQWFFKSCGSGIVECKIINTAEYKRLPLVYDVLLTIFYFSTQRMLQSHFHELLDYYYNSLKEKVHGINFDIVNILPREIYQEAIKKFTPFVKLEVALLTCRRYLEPLRLLFDLDRHCYRSIWNSIVEINDSILYTNLSKEDCYEIVKNKIGTTDYEFLNWKLTPLEIRSGYLGDYYSLTINIKQNDEIKTLNLFAKYLPTYNEHAKEIAKCSFEKEEFFYVKFISDINNLGLEEITDFHPKCYFSRSDDVIILEDMSVMNFRSLGRGEALTFENVLLVTKQFAKLHASSLLYEEMKSDKLGKPYRISDEFGKFVEESLLVSGEDGQPTAVITCGMSGNLKYLLDAFPDIPKKFSVEEFKEKVRDLYKKIGELKSPKFRNVLCQGDPWGNNFLFKRDVNDKPTECCIIDYQLIRYCPPSHDLLFFLYINTDKETRRKYMSKIISEYYTAISQILDRYGYDLSNIYTFNEFLESCAFIKPKAVSLASVYLQFLLYPEEKLENLMLDQEKVNHIFIVDRKEITDEVHHNESYRMRMREIFEELYEICESDL